MTLQIHAYEDAQAFETLREEWDALLSQSQRPCIFLTWEWQSNWWAAYHPGELWLLAVRDEAGQLVALAPWFVDTRPTGRRWVRSIGCVDVTDYLELILKADHESAALQALTDYTRAHHSRYDELDFCNLPEASPTLTQWPPLLEAAGYSVTIKPQEVCPVITLPSDWEGYLNMLDSKQAGELRRKMRHAKGYQIDWGFIEPNDDLPAAIERFMALMHSSSPEKAAFLETPQHVDFFQRIVPALQTCGWLKLSFLQVEGKDAAAYLSFDYNNQIMLYNSGHNPQVAAKISPGILLLMHIIRDAIETGHSHFDFLRGDEEYKYRAGGQDTRVLMLNAQLKSS
jgi:CelD/BcsL family acetyltransferase involved in cellulose biosynthesis